MKGYGLAQLQRVLIEEQLRDGSLAGVLQQLQHGHRTSLMGVAFSNVTPLGRVHFRCAPAHDK